MTGTATFAAAVCAAAAQEVTGGPSKPPLPHLKALQPIEALPPPSPEPPRAASPAAKAGETGAQPAAGGADVYPLVGQLEIITFGVARPRLAINDRLAGLENAIYHQSFPNLSLADRTQKLKDTLLGVTVDPDVGFGGATSMSFPPLPADPPSAMPLTPAGGDKPTIDPQLLARWRQPFFQEPQPRPELERYALELVNQERQATGLAPLVWDEVSARTAHALVDDLAERETVSHLNKTGENPDLRYTQAGGNDAMTESLELVSGEPARKLNRALVARVIEMLKAHQDDRDAVMSPDATHFAFSICLDKGRDKAIACVEVVTKRGEMQPLPEQVHVGDRIAIKGVLQDPYRFQKVTLAWEGNLPEQAQAAAQDEEPQEEAMPYFPPLDYVAFAHHAEHDREKLMGVLRMTGVVAAIAGGMFIPPVALAAPLIAMAPTPGEPKAAADVPVHGGIKVQGNTFSGTLPVSHQGKEGLYYVTVWATPGESGRAVPVSRRVLIVRNAEPAEGKPGAPVVEEKVTAKEKSDKKEEGKR